MTVRQWLCGRAGVVDWRMPLALQVRRDRPARGAKTAETGAERGRRIGDWHRLSARLHLVGGEEREILDDCGGWLWCQRCERAWSVGHLRVVWDGYGWGVCCSDPACDGAGPDGDLWPYHQSRRIRCPHWPANPEPGMRLSAGAGW